MSAACPTGDALGAVEWLRFAGMFAAAMWVTWLAYRAEQGR